MNNDELKKDWQKVAEQESVSPEEKEDDPLEFEEVDDPNLVVLNHPSYLELEAKLTQAEQLAHDNWEKSVRALAELDNVRRRADEGVAKAHKFGIEKFVESLLPVIDSLEQALQSSPNEDNEALKGMNEGIELTLKLFADAFDKFGVCQINPEGELFNPQQHEAMTMQPAPGVEPNTIITVFQKGYILHGRVVRPARVIVAKA